MTPQRVGWTDDSDVMIMTCRMIMRDDAAAPLGGMGLGADLRSTMLPLEALGSVPSGTA